MLGKIAFYKSHPQFNEVFSYLFCGLEPNTLIAHLRDDTWHEIKFTPFQSKWAASTREILKPDVYQLGLLVWLNHKHTLN